RSSRRCGGNKVRGLEFLLGPAPADVVYLTAGGTGSSHCLATTVHAGALGARTVLAQFPQPDTDASRAVATACAARAALVLLARHGIRLPPPVPRFPLAVVDGVGPGYGHPTPAGDAARRLVAPHGLVLDPTYGAKAFAAVPELARRGFRRIVFWHTFALPLGE